MRVVTGLVVEMRRAGMRGIGVEVETLRAGDKIRVAFRIEIIFSSASHSWRVDFLLSNGFISHAQDN